ncbi:hypothetical protein V8B55DRAFT_1112021 [Mucor lusitanicus]
MRPRQKPASRGIHSPFFVVVSIVWVHRYCLYYTSNIHASRKRRASLLLLSILLHPFTFILANSKEKCRFNWFKNFRILTSASYTTCQYNFLCKLF